MNMSLSRPSPARRPEWRTEARAGKGETWSQRRGRGRSPKALKSRVRVWNLI